MLEAMAAGCPVIACEDAVPSVLAEVALTFPARDPVAARTLLERVLRDAGLARNLVIQGQERARQYTWDRCAAQTAQIYREVLKEQTRR
jgi:glycosyltransferase involved in cell wall biosynthesis